MHEHYVRLFPEMSWVAFRDRIVQGKQNFDKQKRHSENHCSQEGRCSRAKETSNHQHGGL